ncbi:hypothetical protein B0O99DRAFT_601274 [Bisporella sp. PMI_857]|nr:hypothetical protein B0O99DRAFT_601274 [Bisporella sp. PMI_857]
MATGRSIIQECRKAGIAFNASSCIIEFNSTGHVVSFGGIKSGEFNGDPDIAGAGVFRAFMLLSIFVTAMGIILAIARGASFVCSYKERKQYKYVHSVEWSNTCHVILDNFILSSADTQLLLVLAFGFAFYSTSQCEISLYHYFVTYHMALVGLATSILAFILARNPFRSFFSSIVRLAAIGFCLIPLLSNLGIPEVKNPEIQKALKKIPKVSQKDSLLILPAYCVLEASNNPFSDLTTNQKEHLNNTGRMRHVRAHNILLLVVWSLTSLAFILTCFWNYGEYDDENTEEAGDPDAGLKSQDIEDKNKLIFRSVARITVWVICIYVIIWNWINIGNLRKWIDRGDWLNKDNGGNPESKLQGIGQIAPLAALSAGAIAFLDGVWDKAKERRCCRFFNQDLKDERRSQRINKFIELQPLQN